MASTPCPISGVSTTALRLGVMGVGGGYLPPEEVTLLEPARGSLRSSGKPALQLSFPTEVRTMRSVVLWLLGVPVTAIILLNVFGVI